MDDVIAKLEDLAPVAEAIVYLTRQGARVKELSSLLSKQETKLQTGEERLAEIERLCQTSKAGAEQARASVIEAQGKIEQMIEGAKAEAKRTIAEAKQQAQQAGEATSKAFIADHVALQNKILDARALLIEINADIKSRKEDHKLVMDSLASLKARLGAA